MASIGYSNTPSSIEVSKPTPSRVFAMMRHRPVLWITYLVLVLNTISSLIPIVWTLSNSFRSNTQIFSRFALIPEQFAMDNYGGIMRGSGLTLAFANSLSITSISLAVLIVCVVPCSFILARFKFRLSQTLYMFFALAIFIPNIVLLESIYKLFSSMNLLGHEYSIVLAYTSAQIPFSVFLLVSYMKEISPSLEEAALIDGANVWNVFTQIILPMSRNGIVTILILAFVAIWNDYIYALVFLPEPQQRTLTVALAFTKSEFTVSYGMLSAAAIVAIVPVFVFYLFTKNFLMSGMSAGAIKG